MNPIKPIFFEEERLFLLDQRKIPLKEEYFECNSFKDTYYAIKEMVARGAPLIGAVAAYGVVLACKEFKDDHKQNFIKNMDYAIKHLAKSRPTAVNLFWALRRMEKVFKSNVDSIDTLENLYTLLINEAHNICYEDLETNYQMARYGVKVVKQKARILTHCNTGALATTGYGTALGVVREAHYVGKDIKVYVDETRPRLQGTKLTSWELQKEQIPFTLIADSVSAVLMKKGYIDLILVGADRIAPNGDVANKIGTYGLSVLAKQFDIPFYVVAPTSTIDLDISCGDDIQIEERKNEEVTNINGVRVAPDNIQVYNPAFDVTPSKNITGIITEVGILGADKNSIREFRRKGD
ncbi:S-methyl-5-thioribose-1-phosphate isomerase [Natranaerobius trueperi]|uniref:Methylthioribose-1-phosphate isomerase n=1 Tax=Natranaerobius trueperi TaxID=759412 RepID=A0A226C0U2_9FIRM|nr:S-methyl-5-thioribose-1-phosphate isomerase [Natranaerobius trueperi]OWZ84781.1 S-methyl-5-thioribose-1-phosphate isomerase [Natranaerobius trueperi]